MSKGPFVKTNNIINMSKLECGGYLDYNMLVYFLICCGMVLIKSKRTQYYHGTCLSHVMLVFCYGVIR